MAFSFLAASKPVLIVLRAGDSVPSVAATRGEFPFWIQTSIGSAWSGEFQEIDVRTEELGEQCMGAAGFVITGSSSSVLERAPWMLRMERFLVEAVRLQKPVLGICFGHQILAQALGGDVQRNPRGREIGTVLVKKHQSDPLWTGLPEHFWVNATHVDTVTLLPQSARVLAQSDQEPTAAFAIHNARGVQFHPEMDGDIMRGYLQARRETLTQEGRDVEALLDATQDTPIGNQILQNFVNHFVRSKEG